MRRLKETRQSLHAGVLDEGELVLRKAKDGWEERRELMAAASRAVSHLSDTISCRLRASVWKCRKFSSGGRGGAGQWKRRASRPVIAESYWPEWVQPRDHRKW